MWDELEETLLAADAGVETSLKLVENLRARASRERMRDPSQVYEALREELVALLKSPQARGALWPSTNGDMPQPAVILVVGVNGTGKTTSIGKLAGAYTRDGKRSWLRPPTPSAPPPSTSSSTGRERAGVRSSPTSRARTPAPSFSTLLTPPKPSVDLVLIDTAGRLHNKST